MPHKLFRLSLSALFLTVSVLLVAAGANAAGCPDSDEDALLWLDRMSRSTNEVNYHGVVTFRRGEEMQVMQVSHSVAGGTSSERLTQLTGQGARVVRVDHPLHCIHPGHKILQLGVDLRAGECGIARYYRFRLGEGNLVAGRKAARISIEPRDMYRYGYIMELDRETGLLLKTETVGRGQKVLETFQFANLAFDNPVQGTSEVNVVHRAKHPHPNETETVGADVRSWEVKWLPGGFTLTDASGGNSARKTYTDGLSVFSVFMEELGREIKPGEGLVRRGGTTSYTRGLRLAERPVLVTVIGEVPVNTARMVADSIVWVP